MTSYFADIASDALTRFQWHFVELAEEGDVLYLWLNNPERRNALNPIMLNELAYALAYFQTKASLRFLRLRAKGEVFCAGADLRGFAENIPHHSTVPKAEKPIIPQELFAEIDKPVLAEVTGRVIAGGVLLLTEATFVIAHQGVEVSLPEIHRGLFPFQVMKALAAYMPPRLALHWCLLGGRRAAAELHAHHIITHLVDKAEEVFPAGDRLLEALREGAPLAMQKGIHAYRRLAQMEPAELYKLLMELALSEDAREGLQAFLEKRKPQWKGR